MEYSCVHESYIIFLDDLGAVEEEPSNTECGNGLADADQKSLLSHTSRMGGHAFLASEGGTYDCKYLGEVCIDTEAGEHAQLMSARK